jgi:tRNA1(Val) A37 N6-methylase TrmN6
METIKLLGGHIQWHGQAPRPSEDAFWLAASVSDLNSGTSVLDVGCGAAPVMLAMAQRMPQAKYSGIEIDATTAAFAKLNSQLNNLDLTIDVADITTWKANKNYDVIVSNPPFHSQTRGHITPNLSKMRAHSQPQNLLPDWLKAMRVCLQKKGHITLILHSECWQEVAFFAGQHGGSWHKAALKTHQSRPAKRLLTRWYPDGESFIKQYEDIPGYQIGLRQEVLYKGHALQVFRADQRPQTVEYV